nr:hypothetical protein [Desulfovibrio sp.]
MAQEGEEIRRGKSGRPSADYGDAFASRRSVFESDDSMFGVIGTRPLERAGIDGSFQLVAIARVHAKMRTSASGYAREGIF